MDTARNDIPPLQKDMFWLMKEVEPIYSAKTADSVTHPFVGSAAQAMLVIFCC